MPTTTETYYYRVQQWAIPVLSPWLPQKWTMQRSTLRAEPPRGLNNRPKLITKGKRTVWEWVDNGGTPKRVVVIRLAKPITETYEYYSV